MFELLLTRQEYGRPFALPPGTPPDVVATFRQAFRRWPRTRPSCRTPQRCKADIVVGTATRSPRCMRKTYAHARGRWSSAPSGIQERAGRR